MSGDKDDDLATFVSSPHLPNYNISTVFEKYYTLPLF